MSNGISRFQQRIRTTILQELEMGPASIAEVVSRHKLNYHSVRVAMRALTDEGVVKPVDTYSYRNVKFTLGTDSGPNNIIPLIRTSNDQVKLQVLLELRKSDKPAAVRAVHNIPMHVARILKASERLAEGRGELALTLDSIRHEMELDLKSLEASISVYQQLLDNDRIWNPDMLKRFPNDASYDSNTVNQVYNLYFGDSK